VELKTRQLCVSNKTKQIIKKLVESDMSDIGEDSMIYTIRDPLSRTKMELPARCKL